MRRAFVLSFVLSTLLLAFVPAASAQPAACNGQPALPVYDFARECADYAGTVAGNAVETVSCLQKEVFVIVFCDVIGGPFCQLVPSGC
jgi:hypothetical protein